MKSKKAIVLFLSLLAIGSQVDLVAQETPPALSFKMKSIDGSPVSLSKYSGKVVVFVNVASKCGYTPQYKQLQELHKKYADQGVAVVGIPCNQFLGQEPGTDTEILEFCKKNYGVEFDLMSKVDVKGKDQVELYRYLTEQDLAPLGQGPVKWNFEKFVIGKNGKPIARFGSGESPDSEKFISVIEKALEEDAQPTDRSSLKPYSHESKKLGKPYYLFSKQVPLKNSDSTSTIYFFSKLPTSDKGTPVARIPDDKTVSETKTGMLVLKNKETNEN